MFRPRTPLASKAVPAVLASLIVLAPPASFAQSGYGQQARRAERQQVYRTPLEVWLSGEGYDEDYSSSHVCVGGYRWITRNTDHGNSSAAQAAVPVRC